MDFRPPGPRMAALDFYDYNVRPLLLRSLLHNLHVEGAQSGNESKHLFGVTSGPTADAIRWFARIESVYPSDSIAILRFVSRVNCVLTT